MYRYNSFWFTEKASQQDLEPDNHLKLMKKKVSPLLGVSIICAKGAGLPWTKKLDGVKSYGELPHTSRATG